MMNKSLEPKQSLELVREFHKIYKQPIKESPDLSDEKTNFLRISLLQEELDELKDAI